LVFLIYQWVWSLLSCPVHWTLTVLLCSIQIGRTASKSNTTLRNASSPPASFVYANTMYRVPPPLEWPTWKKQKHMCTHYALSKTSVCLPKSPSQSLLRYLLQGLSGLFSRTLVADPLLRTFAKPFARPVSKSLATHLAKRYGSRL
jgi:hypothetical protein